MTGRSRSSSLPSCNPETPFCVLVRITRRMTYPPMYGGRTIEYRMDPDDGWRVDLEDIRSKMDESVRLLRSIQITDWRHRRLRPSKRFKIAEEWPGCAVVADEIYDGLNFAQDHVSMAAIADEMGSSVPVITFNGVSKVYYAPGWRIGYLAIRDPQERFALVRDGIERLLRSRLCASTPAQRGHLAGLQGPKE